VKYKVEVLGKPVATLERTGVNKCVLTYESTAIENDFISLTMPVQTESWVWEKGLHPFFQMNLPEGYLLKILQERVGAFVNDPVFLLSLVGGNMIRLGSGLQKPGGITSTSRIKGSFLKT